MTDLFFKLLALGQEHVVCMNFIHNIKRVSLEHRNAYCEEDLKFVEVSFKAFEEICEIFQEVHASICSHYLAADTMTFELSRWRCGVVHHGYLNLLKEKNSNLICCLLTCLNNRYEGTEVKIMVWTEAIQGRDQI